MRTVSAVLAAAWLAAAAAARAGDDPHPVTPVDRVDLARYTGVWHEVARIPNRFQDQCARATTATYTLREDGRLTVVNRCLQADGEPDVADGVARVVPGSGGARLEVSFVSFFGWRPFWGDYWVIGLDDAYGWAVVGTPDRKVGWVLARTPTLPAATRDRIDAILRRNGYRPEDFVPSPP